MTTFSEYEGTAIETIIVRSVPEGVNDRRFRYFVDREELVGRLVDFVEAYVVPLAGR